MASKRIAVVGIPGAWSSERLKEAFLKEGAEAFLVPYDAIAASLPSLKVRLGSEDALSVDAVVVKKLGDSSDITLTERVAQLKAIQSMGTPVFSPPEAIEAAIDRMRMTLHLALAGVPMPRTLITERAEDVLNFLREVQEVVVKPLFTSKARGMIRVGLGKPEAEKGALEAWKQTHGPFFYAQEFIPAKGMRDIGVMFLGGEFLKAYARVAREGSWKTTTAEGGYYEPYDLPGSAFEIAKQAERVFGLSYAGVDLVEGPDGFLVYEVSAFGGFRGLHEAYGLDAARLFAGYVLRRLA
jgi:ribosomal protein S6--L-glutamate ligase